MAPLCQRCGPYPTTSTSPPPPMSLETMSCSRSQLFLVLNTCWLEVSVFMWTLPLRIWSIFRSTTFHFTRNFNQASYFFLGRLRKASNLCQGYSLLIFVRIYFERSPAQYLFVERIRNRCSGCNCGSHHLQEFSVQATFTRFCELVCLAPFDFR